MLVSYVMIWAYMSRGKRAEWCGLLRGYDSYANTFAFFFSERQVCHV